MKTINAIFAIVAGVVALTGCNEKAPAVVAPSAAAPAVVEAPRETAPLATIVVQDRPMPKPRPKDPRHF